MKKILVLQLARLGDVLQTWPTIQALHRSGDAEIHLLTRSRFSVAVPENSILKRHWLLDSRNILAPLIDEKPAIDTSLKSLSEMISELRAEGFSDIINLSFSPLSSFLTKAVASPTCEVRGYTRHRDGFLSIPDDASAYFYAQVGPGRANRVHLTDLFAHVAGVELSAADWSWGTNSRVPALSPELEERTAGFENPILLHVGASQLGKTLEVSKWLQVIRRLTQELKAPVILIGSKEEAAWSVNAVPAESPRVLNLVGETDFSDLVALVARARLVVGADSAPMHVATLVGTPAFCVSLPAVSLWETGPKSAGSRILHVENPVNITSEEIAREIVSMLRSAPPSNQVLESVDPMHPYRENGSNARLFEWEFLKAMYMGEPFPVPPHETYLEALRRLSEVNEMALEQIATLKKRNDDKIASSILDRGDEIMARIGELVPEVSCLLQWFNVEKTRIAPQGIESLIQETESLHRKLGSILDLYVAKENQDVETGGMP